MRSGMWAVGWGGLGVIGGFGVKGSQRLLGPLLKEYTSNYTRNPNMNVHSGILGFGNLWVEGLVRVDRRTFLGVIRCSTPVLEV